MHRIFQEDPGIFARTFEKFGVPFAHPVEVSYLPTDLTEIQPLERRVDTLLRFDGADGDSRLLLVEAQSKRDPAKPSSWAYYTSHLYAKYKVPPLLLVVCQDRSTARWAAGPFRIGPPQWATLQLRPLVVGPDNTPVITDPSTAAEDIPLAALSAITHAYDKGADAILKALAGALKTVDETTAGTFVELVSLGLTNSPALNTWRTLMAVDLSFFRSPIANEIRDEGRQEGRASAKAEDVLKVLDARGITLTDAHRQHLTTCQDLDLLDTWFDRSLVATTGQEIFAGGGFAESSTERTVTPESAERPREQ
ncbi:hypothetical protein SLNWT_5001 [Streptomyces albus]|uniref:Transposase (putative) YhgA-like domain-containing protein n=3 Tax=Streptomyces TaxID=1883 RepID=A0A0B5F4V5_STRA4|nr:hypothetical protein SLNWT_5001 [Streptomyces albus]AYN35404.1 hypothetical protein DUI70_4906 [Streptomyces albus]